MWWDVPSKKRPTYISPERGVRRCEDVALYCIGVEDKVGDKTKHAIISIQQPRSSNTELNIATRALWDHNMHNI